MGFYIIYLFKSTFQAQGGGNYSLIWVSILTDFGHFGHKLGMVFVFQPWYGYVFKKKPLFHHYQKENQQQSFTNYVYGCFVASVGVRVYYIDFFLFFVLSLVSVTVLTPRMSPKLLFFLFSSNVSVKLKLKQSPPPPPPEPTWALEASSCPRGREFDY